MALSLSDFVNFAKRKGRYGDISSNSDQAASDIIQSLNLRRKRFWRKYPWDWSLEDISITVAVGVRDYTLSANVGDIYILDAGEDDFLKVMTEKRYAQWVKRDGEAQGDISHYLKRGRDSSGNFKLRFWRTPSSVGTITGLAKKRLTDYTTSDISTVSRLEFFPDEVLDILMEGVLADIEAINGDKTAAQTKENLFEAKLTQLIPEDVNDPDAEITTPPPDHIIFARRKRGGTTVV